MLKMAASAIFSVSRGCCAKLERQPLQLGH